MDQKIAVIGGGSWATALVKVLREHGLDLTWYMRDSEKIKHILEFHRSPKYLRALELDVKRIRFTSDIESAVDGSDILLLAIPSFFLREALKPIQENLSGKIIISAVKGMIPVENLIIGEYLNRFYNVSYDSIVILSGPTHAEEIAMERLSYLTIACQNARLAEQMASLFECFYIRTVLSDDIFGTEYASVLKNIMAIASGIYHGLGYGDNFQAVLISNAIQEIKRFVDGVHPIQRDIKSSAYLGDLLVTSYSQFSRNRTFGAMIGKGYSVKAAQLEMNMVAEGYFATKCIMAKNKKYQISLPITEAVFRVLYENISPMLEMRLLTRHLK